MFLISHGSRLSFRLSGLRNGVDELLELLRRKVRNVAEETRKVVYDLVLAEERDRAIARLTISRHSNIAN